MIRTKAIHYSHLQFLILLLVSLYGLVAVFLGVTMEFEFLQSDVLGYWKKSNDWQILIHPFHLPFYPIIIAFLRVITFGFLPPLALLMLINFTAYVVGVLLVYKILEISGVSEINALIGAGLFGLWPFTGLVNAVYPLADVPAITLFLAGLYFLMRSRFMWSALFLGLSMITHKIMWVFVAVLLAAHMYHHRRNISWKTLAAFSLFLIPLVVIWIIGSSQQSSFTWILSNDINALINATRSFPVFDGVIATLIGGGAKAVVKGGSLLFATILSISLLYATSRYRPHEAPYAVAISLAVLLLAIAINQTVAWAIMRFAKLLVLPLIWNVRKAGYSPSLKAGWVWVAFLALIFSQFAFAWYMAALYYQ